MADLSAMPGRVQRLGAGPRLGPLDGDKSPAESGENSPHSIAPGLRLRRTGISNAILLTVVSLVAFASTTFAQISKEKEHEIRRLLETTGTTKAVTQMKGQLITQFRTMLPDVPANFWSEMEKELDVEELIKLMLPIYDKHLSMEDLKAVNAFYATPAGKRLAEKTPIMTAEGFEVGRKWGEAKGELVVKRLKEKGLKTP